MPKITNGKIVRTEEEGADRQHMAALKVARDNLLQLKQADENWETLTSAQKIGVVRLLCRIVWRLGAYVIREAVD